MIGDSIGPYRITGRLGAGGMGVVYRAHDTRLERDVAIKFLPPELSRDAESRARFMQEARAASALDHPNIGAIHQIDETPDGRMYLVMAFYDGETLDHHLQRGTFSAGEAARIGAQIAEGLARAHARGIVHRDIKPSNVMRTREGQIKILDFGLARLGTGESLTRTGTSLGTPAYMSPEQVRGETADQRADLWSLGALLYALVAGRSPFESGQLHQIMYAILERDPAPLPEDRIPPALSAVITRALQRDPAARYPDAASMAAALRPVAQAFPGAGPALSTAETAPALPPAIGSAGAPRSAPVAAERLDRGRGRALWVAAGAVVAALAAWLLWPHLPFARASVLRVVALPPDTVAGADSAAAADAASGVQVAVLRGLGGLQGVVALDPADVRGLPESAPGIAAALSAEALVGSSVRAAGAEWRIALRRLEPDGSIRWTHDFSVPRDQAMLLADAVIAHLLRGFPERRLRGGDATQQIASADYEVFLELRGEFARRGGGSLDPAALEKRIEALRRRAPGFAEIHLLEADHALYRYAIEQDGPFLERANAAAARAHELAPQDPRPAARLFDAALRGGRLEEAATRLEELRRLDPGNAEVDARRAALAERRGDVDAARHALQSVVARAPTREFRYALADLEYRNGRYDESRSGLAGLVRDHPDYLRAASKLAELELLYGDLARAESLYAALVERAPNVSSRVANLGLSRMMLGRYDAAAVDLERALELSPESSSMVMNLADCEKLRGRADAAARRYGDALEMVRRNPSATAWENRLVRAQCAAHLGRFQEAVAEAQEALREAPENSEVLYMASLVYALAGERSSALVNARRALEAGVAARWFSLPWFDLLRDDEEFQHALAVPRSPG